MSFLTGTNVELIAGSMNAGTANVLSNSSAQAVINNGAGAAYLPVGFFNGTGIGKKLRVVADGLMTTTGSPGSFNFGISFDSTVGTWVTGTSLNSALLTAPTSCTAGQWHLDVELAVQSYGEPSGATVTVGAYGFYTLPAAATTSTCTVGQFNGTPVALAWPAAYYVELSGKFSTAVSGQEVTCENFSVYGVN